MESSIFDRITVNQDQFLNASFWELSGQVSVPRSGWGVQKQSFGIVQSGVFESKISATNQQPTWNQAGWIVVYSYQQFCFSKWVPLGDSFIFLPPERDEYEVFFSPVKWVFGLTAELRRFTGIWSERLRRIEASIDDLPNQIGSAGPDVDGDYLDGNVDDPILDEDYENVTDGGYI